MRIAVYEEGESNPLCTTIEVGTYNLGGTVFADGEPIDEGFAYLYKMDDNQIVDVFASFISDYGYYDFYQVEEGDYILKAELSPNSPMFYDYIPTYYGDVSNWVDATVIHLEANNWSADVNMIAISNAMPGPGLISGHVTKEIGYENEFGPVANIQIFLMDQDDNVLEYLLTDEEGYYGFENIGFGTYKVMAEVLGKYATPAEVTLDEDNPTVEDLNFVISGDFITLSIDENLPEFIAEIGNIYPNPVVTEAHMQYRMNEPKTVQVTLVNIMGQVILNYTEESIIGTNQLNINTQEMEYGMYYIYLNFNNSFTVVRKFVKTK